MVTKEEEIKKYREDGSLMYECTIAYLHPSKQHLYDRRMTGKKGCFIRVNHATKYKQSGDIEWRLIYNNYGEVIGTHKGTVLK